MDVHMSTLNLRVRWGSWRTGGSSVGFFTLNALSSKLLPINDGVKNSLFQFSRLESLMEFEK